MTDTSDWTFTPGELDLDGAMTLIVGRRSGVKIQAGKIEFANDATTELRAAVKRTVNRLGELTPRQYEPSLVIGEGEYMAVADQLVAEAAPPLKRRGSGAADIGAAPASPNGSDASSSPNPQIETDPEVRRVLRRAAGQPLWTAPELTNRRFQFYAVVVGDTPEARVAFVRKRNPVVALGSGMIFAHRNRLTSVTEPLLLLDDHFDLVVTSDGIAVLSQSVFDALFRDSKTLVARYPLWAKAFSTLGLDNRQTDILVERCRQNSRLATRLRQIHESGHLKAGNVTSAQVFAQAKVLKINKATIAVSGKLDFSCADVNTLLKLLNDDLFIGGLSKVPYEAGSKFKQRKS